MKILFPACMVIIFYTACTSPTIHENNRLSSNMQSGILKSVEEPRALEIQNFTIPVGATKNNIIFDEDGTVYVRLDKSGQIFNITGLQQTHRLNDIKKMAQLLK